MAGRGPVGVFVRGGWHLRWGERGGSRPSTTHYRVPQSMYHGPCMRFLYIICDCVCACVGASAPASSPLRAFIPPWAVGPSFPLPYPGSTRSPRAPQPVRLAIRALTRGRAMAFHQLADCARALPPRTSALGLPILPRQLATRSPHPVPPGPLAPVASPARRPGPRGEAPQSPQTKANIAPAKGDALARVRLGAPAPPSSHRPSGSPRPRPPPANVRGSGPRPRGPAHPAPPRKPSELANWQTKAPVRRRQRPRCRKPRGLAGGRARLPTGLAPREGSQHHGVSQRPMTAMSASQLAKVSGHAARNRRGGHRGLLPPSRPPALPRAMMGRCVCTNLAKDRADAQRLVATRLLDRLHDPLGHISRLQRIHPRAR